ncbi:MAG: S9 family peptidase, partial [Bacteroidales bacterium]
IVYGVKYYSVAENKGNTDIYLMKADGSEVTQLTKTPQSEWNLQWRPDGKRIAFLKATPDHGAQIFEMDVETKKLIQISSDVQSIDAFAYSPDQSKMLLVKQVQAHPTIADRYPDLDKSSGLIYNDLMYRHWDEWLTTIPHLFLANITDGKVSEKSIDLLNGEPYEAPMKPFGGLEQVNWSPNSQSIAYTSRKLVGKEYALSTNSDIYIYNLNSKQTTNVSKGMMGYDMNPVFSPDGNSLAWESMERNGYEADKIRLIVLNLTTGKSTDYTQNFDQNAQSLTWAADAKSIYFLSTQNACAQIYNLNLAQDTILQITKGVHDYVAVMPKANQLIGVRMSMSMPSEIFAIQKSGAEKQLSFINKDILDQLDMGAVQERWIKTSDGKEMLTWVILPPNFDSTKQYPTLLYCQGGPQSALSQFWSYRWNFQIMAANEYIIVAPNRRGLPGFGQAWNEQISGDYGGQNMNDYLSAIDALAKESYVDVNRLGCVGASYGGFSVYWLAGHHNKRFKAFIAHDGMFNLEAQYLETEELWFVNWDLGGPYWDKSNAIAQRSYANSPHKFVDQWDTPILIVQGEKDYRIVTSQALSAFNAALLRGIPAELLVFPDENHWVLQPQNGILWQRRFFRWLDKWVKQSSESELEQAYHADKSKGASLDAQKKESSKEQNTETQVSQ